MSGNANQNQGCSHVVNQKTGEVCGADCVVGEEFCPTHLAEHSSLYYSVLPEHEGLGATSDAAAPRANLTRGYRKDEEPYFYRQR